MGNCRGCIFEGEFRDMGSSVPVCNRCDNLVDAIAANNSKTPCEWHITKSELIKLQNMGITVFLNN